MSERLPAHADDVTPPNGIAALAPEVHADPDYAAHDRAAYRYNLGALVAALLCFGFATALQFAPWLLPGISR